MRLRVLVYNLMIRLFYLLRFAARRYTPRGLFNKARCTPVNYGPILSAHWIRRSPDTIRKAIQTNSGTTR